MVKVEHILEKEVVKGEADNPAFILTNKKAGFLFLSALWNVSKFQGFYFLRQQKHELMKTIESINLVNMQAEKLVNDFYDVKRISGNTVETFFMNNDSFLYKVDNFNGEAELVLDCRKIYDHDDKGRIYKITKERGFLVVEYTKYKDNNLKKRKYQIYLVIRGITDFNEINTWGHYLYSYDNSRASCPYELYVYKALRFKINDNAEIIFAHSDNKKKAKEKANYLYKNLKHLTRSQKSYAENICYSKIKSSKNVRMAFSCAKKALDDLINEIDSETGIFAGLPWFFQFWTRDEGISLKALILNENYSDAKRILVKHLKKLLPDGRLKNINFGEYKAPKGSADGVYWIFKRLQDFIKILKRKRILRNYFSHQELLSLQRILEHSISNIEKYYMKNGLIYNAPLETWMDTDYENDTRGGYRIEIQALHLSTLNFMKELYKMNKDKKNYNRYFKLEKEMAKNVREKFYDNGNVFDGLTDYKIRPNIFLAYYIYPKLLKKSEWQKAFVYALKKLWLGWGGLSTIGKDSYLFCSESSGENPKSYHRGDSWFFMNNLAALCMHRLNRRKFKHYIEKILNASTQDILFNGTIACHAELSSASSLKSEGTWLQAWSCAMFVELVKEIYK